jgi:LmbE family N-acetylglucosaminyl deacetylase
MVLLMRTNPTISSLGTVLGVWAHPDDEAFASAGLMALARRHGQRVVVVTATAGEGGGDPGVRRRELAASLASLGVTEHHWLHYADGACSAVPLSLGRDTVGGIIDEVRPDTILTFGPDGLTGHPDHRAVSAWTTAAWQATPTARLWHATFTTSFHTQWGAILDRLHIWMDTTEPPATPPDRLAMDIECSGALLECKLTALRAHASQTSAMMGMLGKDLFARLWRAESFVEGSARITRLAA